MTHRHINCNLLEQVRRTLTHKHSKVCMSSHTHTHACLHANSMLSNQKCTRTSQLNTNNHSINICLHNCKWHCFSCFQLVLNCLFYKKTLDLKSRYSGITRLFINILHQVRRVNYSNDLSFAFVANLTLFRQPESFLDMAILVFRCM